MRLPLVSMILLILANAGIDAYICKVLRSRCRRRWPSALQMVSAAALAAYAIVAVSLPRRSGHDGLLIVIMWMLFAYFSIYIPKFLFFVIDLLSQIPRLWKRGRVRLLGTVAWIVAVATFVLLWWSALVTRNDLEVKEITVEIPDLPEAFNGYRILQFSDAHVGSYAGHNGFLQRAVETINSLDADLVVFTGDIVNMRSDELLPHARVLSGVKARDGVLSILGNHDYGDYSEWPSPQAKAGNMELLYATVEKMGWRLLRDETVRISHGGDSLAIIGVENIGDKPFPTYGNLARAYRRNLADSVPKILLTHNPRHWQDSIQGNPDVNIALTLSGHTHAMQCEMLDWSPAVWRYPLWGGLYGKPGNLLYVNIGLGTVGFPVRIGQARPELTLITLKRQK